MLESRKNQSSSSEIGMLEYLCLLVFGNEVRQLICILYENQKTNKKSQFHFPKREVTAARSLENIELQKAAFSLVKRGPALESSSWSFVLHHT